MKHGVTFESLSPAAMQISAQAILASADIVFVLWPDGEIADVTTGASSRIKIATDGLLGISVSEIAEGEGQLALEEIVKAARQGAESRSVRVVHSAKLAELTGAKYSAHLAEDGKRVILIGKLSDCGAQFVGRFVENEIQQSRIPNIEQSRVKYEKLFEASPEGIIIVDAISGEVTEANRKAAEILSDSDANLVGTELRSYFMEEFDAIFPSVINVSAPTEIILKSISGSTCCLICSFIRLFDRAVVLVRLMSLQPAIDENGARSHDHVLQLVQHTSIPIVLADEEANALWGNAAFSDLIDCTQLNGKSLSELMGCEQEALRRAIQESQRSGRFMTSLACIEKPRRREKDLKVAVVSIPSTKSDTFGFLFYKQPFNEASLAQAASFLDCEPVTLAQLVGDVPMKDLVKRSTSEIERYCIEAALRLTGCNRTEAANVLGLSRQSFYLKLHQHDLL